MYWASPLTPCSGPKSAASSTPVAAASRSAAWRSRPSTAVGLQTSPTLRPRSARKRVATRTSSPERTPGRPLPRRTEREREGVAPLLLRRVGGIAKVPVGAGTDRGILDRVREHLDERGHAGRIGGDADLERAREVGPLHEPRPVGLLDQGARRLLQRADV